MQDDWNVNDSASNRCNYNNQTCRTKNNGINFIIICIIVKAHCVENARRSGIIIFIIIAAFYVHYYYYEIDVSNLYSYMWKTNGTKTTVKTKENFKK